MHNKDTLFVTLNAVKGLKKDSSLRSEWQIFVQAHL